ncbi:hypothetical protein ACIQU3_06640 [Streptomyces sp. NPDC101110]|uniref:hypothetical protein n=1 Tax=unclassified Streptomyces TaxID=2593676 RepID=UPI0038129058
MTSAISGVGLVAAGAAHADCAGDPPAPRPTVENAQLLHCEQEFDGGSLLTVNAPISVLGDSVTNIGNFCTQTTAPAS